MLPVLCVVVIITAVIVALVNIKQSAYIKSLDAETETLKTVSKSDELNSIESDLNNTSLDNLDKESPEIETLLD